MPWEDKYSKFSKSSSLIGQNAQGFLKTEISSNKREEMTRLITK